MESAKENNIFIEWLIWHFYQMPAFIWQVWNNYFFFALNLFSLPLLLKTFFAPWRKYNWQYPKAFDIAEFFNTLVSNVFSRFLGALVRSVLIIIGIIFQIFVVIAGFAVFASWLLLPFLIASAFLFAFLF